MGDEAHFVAHWAAKFVAPEEDRRLRYQFSAPSDNDVWVFLDERSIIDLGSLRAGNSKTELLSCGGDAGYQERPRYYYLLPS